MTEHSFHPNAFLMRVLAVGGIAGVIALLITLAILFRYVQHGPGEQIPEVLSHALTTILGFYFGTNAIAAGRGASNGASTRTPNSN